MNDISQDVRTLAEAIAAFGSERETVRRLILASGLIGRRGRLVQLSVDTAVTDASRRDADRIAQQLGLLCGSVNRHDAAVVSRRVLAIVAMGNLAERSTAAGKVYSDQSFAAWFDVSKRTIGRWRAEHGFPTAPATFAEVESWSIASQKRIVKRPTEDIPADT